MHQARFDSILSAQSSVAQKIFGVIPRDTGWTIHTIGFEVRRRLSTSIDQRALEGSVAALVEAGLLQEHPKGIYNRVKTHRNVAQVIRKEDMVDRSKRGSMVHLIQKAPADSMMLEGGEPVQTERNVPVAEVKVETAPVAVGPVVTESTIGVVVVESKEVAPVPTVVLEEVAEPPSALKVYDDYMHLQLGHVMQNLRTVTAHVASPMASLLLDAMEDLRGLQRLIRQVPALERKPEPAVASQDPSWFDVERLVRSAPTDQTEMKQAIAACDARAAAEVARTRMPEYKTWTNIRYRQGIEMDPRWKNFDAFFADVGYRPKETARLLRVDKDKGFTKDNMRWKVVGKVVPFVHVKPEGWPWTIE